MANINVFYPTGRNVESWQSAHGDGTVPDLWPYGLNRLGVGPNVAISAVEAAPLRPLNLVGPMLYSSRRFKSAVETTASIAWDEDLSLRLIAERVRGPKLAGVIWLTDRILRGERNLKDALLRKLLPQFEGLWVLSRPQVEVLQTWLGAEAPQIDFLKFGIDHQFFTPWEYPVKPLILSVGRDRDRDPRTLFESLEVIKTLRPDVEIVVQSNSNRTLPDGVTAIPMLSHTELRNYYRKASVVVVATRPNVHVSGMTVALESMATARPTVMCNTPGMNDYVVDGETGMLVTPGDAQALADAVLELLQDPHTAARMGVNGRDRIERFHTSELMSRDLEDLIFKAAGWSPA